MATIHMFRDGGCFAVLEVRKSPPRLEPFSESFQKKGIFIRKGSRSPRRFDFVPGVPRSRDWMRYRYDRRFRQQEINNEWHRLLQSIVEKHGDEARDACREAGIRLTESDYPMDCGHRIQQERLLAIIARFLPYEETEARSVLPREGSAGMEFNRAMAEVKVKLPF